MALFEEGDWGASAEVQKLEKGLFDPEGEPGKIKGFKRRVSRSGPTERRIRGPRNRNPKPKEKVEVAAEKIKKTRRGKRKRGTDAPQNVEKNQDGENEIVSLKKKRLGDDPRTPHVKKLKSKRKEKKEIVRKLERRGPRNKYKHLALKNKENTMEKAESPQTKAPDTSVNEGNLKKKNMKKDSKNEQVECVKLKGGTNSKEEKEVLKKKKVKEIDEKESPLSGPAIKKSNKKSKIAPSEKSGSDNKEESSFQQQIKKVQSEGSSLTDTKKKLKRKSEEAPRIIEIAAPLKSKKMKLPKTTPGQESLEVVNMNSQKSPKEKKNQTKKLTKEVSTLCEPTVKDNENIVSGKKKQKKDNSPHKLSVSEESASSVPRKKKKMSAESFIDTKSPKKDEIVARNTKKIKKEEKKKNSPSKEVPKGRIAKPGSPSSHVEDKHSKRNPPGKQLVKSPFNVKQLKNIFSRKPGGKKDESIAASAKDESTSEDEGLTDEAVHEAKPQNLRVRMQAQLNAARFRYLNEQLYTCTGEEALQIMRDEPDAFKVYHEGYQSQVSKWPKNPVDQMITYINKKPKAVVADFGCGDAKLAQSVDNEVHSFDLVAVNDHVVACNVSNVPLPSESVDIAVFCLSLMGTDLVDFICEANRVLKDGGTLLVAEVVSRFEKIGAFVRKMSKLGFNLEQKDESNKMFIWFEFTKDSPPAPEQHRPEIELAPCIYKKR